MEHGAPTMPLGTEVGAGPCLSSVTGEGGAWGLLSRTLEQVV